MSGELLSDLSVCVFGGPRFTESKLLSCLFVPQTPKKGNVSTQTQPLPQSSVDFFCCGLTRSVLWVEWLLREEENVLTGWRNFPPEYSWSELKCTCRQPSSNIPIPLRTLGNASYALWHWCYPASLSFVWFEGNWSDEITWNGVSCNPPRRWDPRQHFESVWSQALMTQTLWPWCPGSHGDGSCWTALGIQATRCVQGTCERGTALWARERVLLCRMYLGLAFASLLYWRLLLSKWW